jgi:hypothetical protein
MLNNTVTATVDVTITADRGMASNFVPPDLHADRQSGAQRSGASTREATSRHFEVLEIRTGASHGADAQTGIALTG